MTCPFCTQPGSWPACSCDGAAFARSHGFMAATRRYYAQKSDSAPQPPPKPNPIASQPQPPPLGGEAALSWNEAISAAADLATRRGQPLLANAIRYLRRPDDAWINPNSAVDHAHRHAIAFSGPNRFSHACPDINQNADDSHLVFPEETPRPEMPASQPHLPNPDRISLDQNPPAISQAFDDANTEWLSRRHVVDAEMAQISAATAADPSAKSPEIAKTTATSRAAPAAPARDAAPIASVSAKDRKKAANEKRRASCKEYWTPERRQQAREFSIARHAAAKALQALQS